MKQRLTQPKNNKYYIRTVSGGLNGAVAGKPTISGANVLCNCVGYANGRFNESINDPDLKGVIFKFKYQLVCNAENFIESAKKQGLKISATPVEGGIMVWQKGKTLGGGDGAGHVAFVEAVYDDGTILTSESGYNAWAFKTIRRANTTGRWGQASAYKFRGCIINPSIKNPKTVPAPKLSVDGVGGANTVRAMQRFFGTVQDGILSGQSKAQAKYYPALKAVEYGKGGSPCIKNLQRWLGVAQDGILGKKTIKKWQYVIGVDNDGIFGTASMKAWQKYLNAHDKAIYPTITPAVAKKTTTETPKIVDKLQKWYDAMTTQFNWSKKQKYHFNSKPTVANSKEEGTCITFPAVSLQRIGMLPKGKYFYYHPKHKRISGSGASYVKKHTELYKLTYPHKTIATLWKQGKIKKGDIVGYGGSDYHTMVFMGMVNGKPRFNTMGHKKGLNVTYKHYAGKKVDMLVHIKKLK